MKKQIIILVSIIIIFSCILYYKIYKTNNTPIQEYNIYDDYYAFETPTVLPNNTSITDDSEVTKSEKSKKNNNSNIIIFGVTTSSEKQKTQTNSSKSKNNTTNNAQSSKATTSIPQTNNSQNNYSSNNSYTNAYSNKSVTETPEEQKLERYASLGTYKIINKFKGYGYNNIYILSNNMSYVQTDFNTESSYQVDATAELRLLSEAGSLYGIYVNGMSTYVKVAMATTFKSYTVFPQKEQAYYSSQLEMMNARGILNSSSAASYKYALEDLEKNWTHLGYGRVIGLGNYTYWKQISSHTGTFLQNATTYRISYNGRNYLYIDGINDFIEVEEYN